MLTWTLWDLMEVMNRRVVVVCRAWCWDQWLCHCLRPMRRAVRVLTYNIHHGEGMDGKIDLERIAAVIKRLEPDVVALQEVDVKTTRSQGVDQVG